MDIIEKEYFGGTDDVESTALLTLAAFAIGAVAWSNKDEWGVDEETAFYMVRGAVTKPLPYPKEN